MGISSAVENRSNPQGQLLLSELVETQAQIGDSNFKFAHNITVPAYLSCLYNMYNSSVQIWSWQESCFIENPCINVWINYLLELAISLLLKLVCNLHESARFACNSRFILLILGILTSVMGFRMKICILSHKAPGVNGVPLWTVPCTIVLETYIRWCMGQFSF